MAILSVVAILLVLNMLLLHFDKIVSFYYYLYKKLIKPKFKVGEFVIINDIEFEILYILKNERPYTYLCVSVFRHNNRLYESYYHESRIKKKTGLLKELE